MLSRKKLCAQSEKGITLIALMVMIAVIIILTGISTNELIGKRGLVKQARSNVALTELSQIQELILEQYTKYKQTGDESYINYGTSITKAQVENILKTEDITILLKADNYLELTPQDLLKLGIQGTEDNYIVNFSTGEVINSTLLKTAEGDILYICP